MPHLTAQPVAHALIPLPGESQVEFARRFHSAMQDRLPTDRRSEACLAVWREHRGPDQLDRLARERFAKDHTLRRDVPVFKEHQRDDDGELSIYDVDALCQIIERCNHRILDTGDFAPLVDGHTPTEETSPQPDILGWCGPYRLSQVGNIEPRWCIVCDEWHHDSMQDRLRQLPRRSAEVWLEPEMADRFFDPVAALGAEAPWLDLGMTRYHRDAKGARRAKYSAAAVFPAGHSTALVGELKSKNQRGNQMPDLDELIGAVLQAIGEMPEFQWIRDQMGGTGEPEDAVMDAPPAEAPAEPVAEAPPAEPPAEAFDDDDKAMFSRYMAGEADDDEMAEYRKKKRVGSRYQKQAKQSPATPDAAAARSQTALYRKLQGEIDSLKSAREEEQVGREIAERTREIERLAQDFVIQPEALVARYCAKDGKKLRYSREQFSEVLDTLAETSQPLASGYLPTPDDGIRQKPGESAKKTQSADRARRAAQYAKQRINDGHRITFDEALAHIEAQEAASSNGAPVA